jgi:hypothetical protein
MPAGRIVTFRGEVHNTSGFAWEAVGATAVGVGFHWFDADGKPVAVEESRASFAKNVAPGAKAALVFEISTPRTPGSYSLVLDGVRERVAWFSVRRPGQELRRTVQIVPAGGR